MGEGQSGPGSTLPPGAGDSEATPIVPSREPATQPLPQRTEVIPPHPPTDAVSPRPPTDAVPQYTPTDAVPPHPPTDAVSPHPPADASPQHPPADAAAEQATTVPPRQQVTDVAARRPEADASHQPATIMMPRQPQAEAAPYEPVTYQPPPGAAPPSPWDVAPPPPYPPPPPPYPPPPPPYAAPAPAAPSEVRRYGPGVPASQAGVAAESVWRTGRRPEPPPRQRQQRRMRRMLGMALTLILLGAAGIVLYLRFFDHPSFHVTGVRIVHQTQNGCTLDVTGRIATNGAAGTVSYQWVFRPQTQAPQPLNRSVVAGQHAVYVTVAVEGQGHGSASQQVTLDVLGPDAGTDSANVTITC
jgi:hypothetical protein